MIFQILFTALIITCILWFVWESLMFWVLGPPTDSHPRLQEWLDDNVQLCSYNDRILCKHSSDAEGLGIGCVGTHKPSLFSKYYVEVIGDKNFRVLKNSPLHEQIEEKFAQLIAKRKMKGHYNAD